MRLWIAGLSLVLAGCGTLPAKEAEAFRVLAVADRDAFGALAADESKAVNEFALDYLTDQPDAKLTLNGCGVDQRGACELALRDADDEASGDPGVTLGLAAPETRALIASLAAYGEGMSELATAKDLDAAKQSAAKAGASVKGLAQLLPGAPEMIGPVVDGAVWLAALGLQEKRRRALLAAAEKADPVVAEAADRMGLIAVRLRANLERTAASDVRKAKLAFDSEPDPVKRAARLQDLLAATEKLNKVRQVRTDYSALKRGHALLVSTLRSNNGDPARAMAELQTFVGILQAIKTASEKEDAPA